MSERSKKRVFIRILLYLKPFKVRIFGGLISTIFMGFSDVLLAPIVGWLIDGLSQVSMSLANTGNLEMVFEGAKIERFGFNYTLLEPFTVENIDQAKSILVNIGIFIVVLIMFKGIFIYAKEYLMASVVQKTIKNFRDQLYSRMLHLKMLYFDRGKTGEIMSRITNDVQVMEHSLLTFVNLAQGIIYTIIFVSALLITDWQLTLFALAVVPIAAGVLKFFSNSIRQASRKIMMKLADISTFLQEAITAIKIIKTYNREDYEETKFSQQTYQNYAHSMKAYRLSAFLKPSNEFLSTVGMTIVILFCGFRILNQQMDISVFTTFAVLISMAYKPIKSLGETQPVIQRALAAAERIFELIEEFPEESSETTATLPKPLKGKVEFKNVIFSYNRTNTVLNDVSLIVESGETVALVGPSGVGKSTILNLLLKFYDLESGSIFVDGIDISTISRKDLRDKMSLVPQETILFSGTVRDNIQYGDLNASEDDTIEAAQIANAHSFIQKLPEGYETEIGERGVQISGGQRQRIAIARAVLKNPPILLLDEATSALDSESENLVQAAITNLMKDRTTVVIAHRLSTIKNADKIVVMDKGLIQFVGKHDELINREGLYKTMYNL